MSLYMVIESFRNGDAWPDYRRFRGHGSMTPEGLTYIASWVTEKLDRCYQIMETADPHYTIDGSPTGVTSSNSK